MRSLLIRADANSRMGTGHVMRSLALAQSWQAAGGVAVFLMADSPLALNLRLADEGIETRWIKAPSGSLADADETVRGFRESDAELLVIDGYHFDAAFQRRLKQHGTTVLALDDYGHAAEYTADFVLNQTNCADENLYVRRAPHTRLLLGTSYVSFRREFWPWVGHERLHLERARRILVTLGGSDPDLVTAKVIDALCQAELGDCDVTVVLGAGNAHIRPISQQFRHSGLRGQVIVNAANMPELMASTDLAITAGGSTIWELALLGVPCISLVLAANQEACLCDLAAKGSVLNLGRHDEATLESIARAARDLIRDQLWRTEMSRRLSSYVDGRGAQRVLAAVAQTSQAQPAAGRVA